ncbi:MAG: hypothetical protein MJ140_02575 [Ligilactobacillus sp.]|nr:hypothetical protein [Ligilactobacillus sp.]
MIEWQNGWLQQCDDFSSFPTKLEQLSQVVKFTSPLAGSKLRLVLSNLYGTTDLVFDCITVSKQADFQAGKRQTLRYQERIRIPKGKKVYLDPCQLTLTPGETFYVWMQANQMQSYADYVVTYAPKLINGTYARRVAYLPKLRSDYQKRKAWFCLEQFLVWTKEEAQVVEITGDSLAEMGMVAEPLFEKLLAAPQAYSFANTAISGSRLLKGAPENPPLFRTYGQSLLQREAGKNFQADITLISIGENDLLLPALAGEDIPSLAQLQAGFRQLQGPNVWFTTLPKVEKQAGITAIQMTKIEKLRQELNTWLLTQPNVIDGAALLLDPKTQAPKVEYSFGDGLHINLLGGQVLAQAWYQAFTH